MNKRLEAALDYCKQAGIARAIFAIPFRVAPEEIQELQSLPVCGGVVLNRSASEFAASFSGQQVGYFTAQGDWQLPDVKGTVILVGSQLMLTRKMALRLLRTRRLTVICKFNDGYRSLKLFRFLLWRAGEKLHQKIRQLPADSLLRKWLFGVAGMPLVKLAWRRIFKRSGSVGLSDAGRADEQHYHALLQAALALPGEEKIKPVPGRVLLVNAGLAAGGAERQIVNTLIGLRDSGRCESVALLAEHIEHAPDLDFFLHELEAEGIEVSQMRHTITLAENGVTSMPPALVDLMEGLPGSILEEILNMVEEFRARRPGVVHAWQDQSSIKAGIAAVIAGVPRIVLASRNVIPTNFTYYKDYMSPAYRALATLDCVKFLNNSEAGAIDYTRWLALPRERFAVVHNGVDLGYLKRVDEAAVSEYRRSLNIPADAKVIGSIFRFWPEKRPMLWLQTAALVIKQFPDAHFLVIGEGIMRREMESFIASHGLNGHVHLPGARPEVATPLSAMNLFMLTSEFEGTPNVVLEAQWLGLPIVATDAGGTRDAFKHEVTGLLAEQPLPEVLATLVSAYLGDSSKCTLAAEEGPRFVAQSFGIGRMVEETLQLYGLPPIEKRAASSAAQPGRAG